ncbi:hypothetical protein [Cellulomonas terrae]|uniref:DUF2933 domain-containing protein n=1 Tax=Cellulomonas terrae TaxID=311234 RepID=A0A511JHM8_9CELL|nr:hypothetical protein [Cellulomonas terrae]GEL97329.1 hypothetical protein CTE05_08760 [Cellulomonas terrae]
MKRHITYMLIAGGVALVGLLLFGVSATDALLWAFVLVCPAMLVVMLFTMRSEEHQSAPEDSGRDSRRNGTPEQKAFGARRPDGRLRG